MLMMLSRIGMQAASTAPNTSRSTMSAAGTPKISPRCRSFSASLVNISLMLASPVCATVKPRPWAASTVACSSSTFFSASSMSPAITTGISVACRSLETAVGSCVS